MTRFILPAFFALSSIAAVIVDSTAAYAEPQQVHTAVRTSDLDLSTEAGRRTLDRRLAQAVRELCGESSPVDLEGQNALLACRTQALSAAHARRDALIAVPVTVAAAH